MTAIPHIAIIGAGPAGLMAAEAAARGGAKKITVYDRMPSAGRKLLLAGRGGLNLTHNEASDRLLARYGAAEHALAPHIVAFDAAALRDWCRALGIETFVGTSGRIFPVGLKTSPLLRAWLRRLDSDGISFALRHEWLGWYGSDLRFDTPSGPIRVAADAIVIALGGASWPQLGSDGGWVPTLQGASVPVAPLQPANCGFEIAWSELFRDKFEGQPLKNVALSFGETRVRGEMVVTRAGLQGGAIYALSGALRDGLAKGEAVTLQIALRPDLAPETLAAKLQTAPKKQSLSNRLRKALNLSPVAIGLLREADPALASLCDDALAARINAILLTVGEPMAIACAISTAGGVGFAGVDGRLMLRARPGVFVAGEMLDWDAPTGGYLLQACFATGRAAGAAAGAWAIRHTRPKVEADAAL